MKWNVLLGLALLSGCGGETAGTQAVTPSPAPAPLQATGPASGCPASWLETHAVDPAIAAPAGAGHVILHVAATGTQDYACSTGADGGAAWKLVGPDAQLADCNGTIVGHHFPSPGGPEWQLSDGSFAVGHKTAQSVPEGKAESVPWLLLQVVGHADAGALANATYVQRVNTNGGVAPASGCGADSGTKKVPYTADYYLYGP